MQTYSAYGAKKAGNKRQHALPPSGQTPSKDRASPGMTREEALQRGKFLRREGRLRAQAAKNQQQDLHDLSMRVNVLQAELRSWKEQCAKRARTQLRALAVLGKAKFGSRKETIQQARQILTDWESADTGART